MGKNRLLQHLTKADAALFFIAAMFAGFLGARSIASVGMFLFAVSVLWKVPLRQWGEQRWYLFGLLWVLIFGFSGYWSANKEEWNAHFQVKYPFIFLPLAFGFLPRFNRKQLDGFTLILIATMLLGAGYSLSFLIRDPKTYIEGYSFSHVLPSPAYGDHISFSMAVTLCIGWCLYRWPFMNRAMQWVCGVSALFLILFLHILAAKTGLLALYLLLLGWVGYLFLSGRWKKGLILVAVLAGGVVAAGFLIPTLRQRIRYVAWSWEQYEQGERSGAYSDVGRVVSYNIAGRIIAREPLKGVGAGDMLDEMKKGYDKWYPHIPDEQRLVPHNQFLTLALGAGIPALLLFIAWIAAPLARIRRNRDGAFFLIHWCVLLVPLMVDPFLEVQFGVFVYLFFLLWWRSILMLPEAGQTGVKRYDELHTRISA